MKFFGKKGKAVHAVGRAVWGWSEAGGAVPFNIKSQITLLCTAELE